jgi:hypothetical protein
MGKDSKEKNADGSPQYPARNTIKKYFYPDQGDVPEPAIDAIQPGAATTARAQAPVNDNRQAAAAAKPAGAKPWGTRK